MSILNWLTGIDLQLFADGGSTGASGGDGGTGADGATSGVTASVPSSQKKGANPLADVKYGIQDSADAPTSAQAQTETDSQATTPIDRVAEFEKLIKGEYKDLYDERVQKTIQSRFKGEKEKNEKLSKFEALMPTLEMLSKKYNVDVSDIEALNKAITDDDAYYEEEAFRLGMPTEQLKSIRKMERENEALKKQIDARKEYEDAEKKVATWMKQAEEAVKSFPGLNLANELQNESFVKLLETGVDVSTAYFAMHHKDLVPQAMQYTARQAEEKVTQSVIANGKRPVENGTRSQSSAVSKTDVSQLTKADREEIARRVARGEKIRF